ncbi:MAG: RagB/SusD family nutrient uptake outer membrane protein [Bacteroidales bacterium]|nr:MAG: RagB/SusD family nutrient uptake outer membrane protein [Bacteroidales bacterium]
MKNNIFKFSLLLFVTFIVTSCNDDFLERYPLDEISSNTFWNTASDLETYNNTFYDYAKNDDDHFIMMGYNNGAWASHKIASIYLDELSDNLAPRHSRHLWHQKIRAGKHTIPSSASPGGWRGWSLLRAVNVGLESYGKADIADLEKNKYIGEAKLFRAWYYFDKVKRFGDVTLITKPLNIDSPELYKKRDSRQDVMSLVLEDINFAVKNLPESWNGDSPGRLDKWDALLIKSRICLFEGTFRRYHGGENVEMWLQEAANAAGEIIANGPHELYSTGNTSDDYRYVHHQVNLSGNKEVMYWRKYDPAYISNMAQGYYQYTGGASKDLVEDYLCTDGLPISLSDKYAGDDKIEDIFVDRDPRLRQTILNPMDKDKISFNRGSSLDYPRFSGMSGGIKSTTGYNMIKIYNADQHSLGFGSQFSAAVVLRYGEVLLNYAEAKAELGNITQTELDESINLLRDRVGMVHMDLGNIPVDPRYSGEGISSLLVEIRRERRVELVGEGFRYDDLLRWKQGKKLEKPTWGMRWEAAQEARYPGANVQTSVDTVTGKTYIDVYKGTDFAIPVFDESKHYLWPVPINAISQNPDLGQNPGWE